MPSSVLVLVSSYHCSPSHVVVTAPPLDAPHLRISLIHLVSMLASARRLCATAYRCRASACHVAHPLILLLFAASACLCCSTPHYALMRLICLLLLLSISLIRLLVSLSLLLDRPPVSTECTPPRSASCGAARLSSFPPSLDARHPSSV